MTFQLYPMLSELNPYLSGAFIEPSEGWAHVSVAKNVVTLPCGLMLPLDPQGQGETFSVHGNDYDLLNIAAGQSESAQVVICDSIASYVFHSAEDARQCVIDIHSGTSELYLNDVRIDHKANSMATGLPIMSLGDGVRWIRNAVATGSIAHLSGGDPYQLGAYDYRLAAGLPDDESDHFDAKRYLGWLLCQDLTVCDVTRFLDDGHSATRMGAASYVFTKAELDDGILNGVSWLSPLANAKATRTDQGYTFTVKNPCEQSDETHTYVIQRCPKLEKTRWDVTLHTDNDETRQTFSVSAGREDEAIALAERILITETYGENYAFDSGEYPEIYVDDVVQNPTKLLSVDDLDLVSIEFGSNAVDLPDLYSASVLEYGSDQALANAYNLCFKATSPQVVHDYIMANEKPETEGGEIAIGEISPLINQLRSIRDIS